MPSLSTQPEFLELLHASRDGDAAALDALFERFYPTVSEIVRRGLASGVRSKRPWIAALFSTRDVVQDVFLGVLRDLDAFHGESERDFVGYLATLTRNRLVDAVRFHQAVRRDGRRLGPNVDERDACERAADPAESAESAEEIARFSEVLATFGERDRILLRDRLEHETPFAALAQKLGYASADSARKAFRVAQARLLARLGPRTRDE